MKCQDLFSLKKKKKLSSAAVAIGTLRLTNAFNNNIGIISISRICYNSAKICNFAKNISAGTVIYITSWEESFVYH